jgi:poly(A) polymerase
MKKNLEQYSKEEHGIYKEDIDPDVIIISDKLISNGFQAFLVGGCIRDILLEKTPKDFDIATDASPQDICKLFDNARMIGRRFKIVHVYTADRKYFEVTTFRSDSQKKIMIKNSKS